MSGCAVLVSSLALATANAPVTSLGSWAQSRPRYLAFLAMGVAATGIDDKTALAVLGYAAAGFMLSRLRERFRI